MSSSLASTHPVLESLEAIERALKDVADVEAAFMSIEDKKAALLAWSSARGRLDELGCRVLAAADDVADAEAMRDPAAWLAHHGRIDGSEARRLQWLARRLDERYAGTARAVREGAATLAQAEVITHALDDLPSATDAEVRAVAETHLVEAAGTFEPRRLRILGRKILDVVAPEVSESAEGAALEREEQAARRRTYLHTRRFGDGTSQVTFRGADPVVERLMTYLHAFTSPRRPDACGDDGAARPAQDRRPYDQQLGAAFASFLEAVDPARLPLHGGDATAVLVTIDLETLRGRLGEAGVALIGDQPISAAEARRLACTASIIPAVLGGDSQLLDLGRSSRLYKPHQRKALALTFPSCAVHGCDIPAPWCEAHHAGVPWAEGGSTDLADGVLVCSFHHHRAHDPRYDLTRHPDGSVRFHRRS
jgi:hypothetical protein